MRYAVSLPPFDAHSDPRTLASLARTTEIARWYAFFIRDHILWDPCVGVDLANHRVALAALATTERIRHGSPRTPGA